MTSPENERFDSSKPGSGTEICSFSTSGEVYFETAEERKDPVIVPVLNGRELEISPELVINALSGISIKHYDGECLLPEVVPDADDFLVEEDYYFEQGESYVGEEEILEKPRTMSSMINLCYVPKKHSTDSECVEEESSEVWDVPHCLHDRINYRNSFWDIHRPELYKLTWRSDYVSEAIVIEHLHKHLLSHGPVCSAFHDRGDMLNLLNRELDLYDKLKEIQPARKLPPDEHETGKAKSRRRRLGPCRPFPTSAGESTDWTDESDLERYQSLRRSKEEFCITIGKPVRKPPLRLEPIMDTEAGQLWLPAEDTEYYEYGYPGYGENFPYIYYNGEAEDSICEYSSSTEPTSPEPTGWVEPDFCAMK